jgi:hypothetical protein
MLIASCAHEKQKRTQAHCHWAIAPFCATVPGLVGVVLGPPTIGAYPARLKSNATDSRLADASCPCAAIAPAEKSCEGADIISATTGTGDFVSSGRLARLWSGSQCCQFLEKQ